KSLELLPIDNHRCSNPYSHFYLESKSVCSLNVSSFLILLPDYCHVVFCLFCFVLLSGLFRVYGKNFSYLKLPFNVSLYCSFVSNSYIYQINENNIFSFFFFHIQCSFLPKFSIYIKTKYEDNNGSNNNTFLNEANSAEKEVCFLDIALDEISERYYKEAEDLRNFVSTKTGRGPLCEGWQNDSSPIMCSYKLVTVKFDVWGLQGRVEQFVHKAIRDVLLIGHRQAFAWVDEWYGMSMEEVRHFESTTQEATNKKLGIVPPVICICEPPALSVTHSAPPSTPSTPVSLDPPEFLSLPKDRPRKSSAPEMLFLPSNKH
uniref:Phosphatidylinositol transfer protein N-terminal domain-containing protein n=1 Tax=Eptatretus burgeri TaxID=7764 RepID=A0A8C4Q157_EPTBU